MNNVSSAKAVAFAVSDHARASGASRLERRSRAGPPSTRRWHRVRRSRGARRERRGARDVRARAAPGARAAPAGGSRESDASNHGGRLHRGIVLGGSRCGGDGHDGGARRDRCGARRSGRLGARIVAWARWGRPCAIRCGARGPATGRSDLGMSAMRGGRRHRSGARRISRRGAGSDERTPARRLRLQTRTVCRGRSWRPRHPARGRSANLGLETTSTGQASRPRPPSRRRPRQARLRSRTARGRRSVDAGGGERARSAPARGEHQSRRCAHPRRSAHRVRVKRTRRVRGASGSARSDEALDAFSSEVTTRRFDPRAVTAPASVETPAETVKTVADVTAPAPAEASTRSGEGRTELGVRAAEAAGHRRALAGEAHGQIVVPELGRVAVRAVAGADRLT